MQPIVTESTWRKWRASWRDTLVLLKEFRKPLLLFILLIVGSGLLYFYLAQSTPYAPSGPIEAIYLTLTLTFFQSGGEFPHLWYLQIFYFLMPFLGIAVLAQGLTDFGVLLFNRRERGKEWEMAVASTFANHIILIGLGHLGFRVVKNLFDMHQDVVVVETKPKPDLVSSIHALDIPIIEDDGTRDNVLEAAGIRKARTIILCTQNDSLNLQMALKARNLNPHIQVVIRIFDDEFATALHRQFGFKAISATGMAAPVFASIAAGIDITPPIQIDGQANSLARLDIPLASPFIGQSINQLEDQFEVSIVLLNRAGDTDYHPSGDRRIQAADVLGVLGTPKDISHLANVNHSR